MKESPHCLNAVSFTPPRMPGSGLFITGCYNNRCPLLCEGSPALVLEIGLRVEHLVVPTGAVDMQGPAIHAEVEADSSHSN